MNEELYILQEDLFRFGNSTSPKLTNLRRGEVTLFTLHDVATILANEQGISTHNSYGMKKNARKSDTKKLTGWVWRIPTGTSLPDGLKVVKDKKNKGHFLICPTHNMPLQQFVGLLDSLSLECTKLHKISLKKTG